MSTAADEASAALVRDQASVSVIASGTVALIVAEEAYASIVVNDAVARTVSLLICATWSSTAPVTAVCESAQLRCLNSAAAPYVELALASILYVLSTSSHFP